MKALCQTCFTSNIECVILGRKAICGACKAKNNAADAVPNKMKYPDQDRFKERWDEKT